MDKMPNLLFITMDCLRPDALGCYGEKYAKTPNIDLIAKQGVVFNRAYCAHPLCMPSRASMLTGRYPSAHGVWANGVDLPDNEVSLAEILRQNGFQTSIFGKLHFQAYKEGFSPDFIDRAENSNNVLPYKGFEKTAIADNTPYNGYVAWLKDNYPQCIRTDKPAQNMTSMYLGQNHILDGRPDGKKLAYKSTLPVEATKTDWIYNQALNYFKNELDLTKPFFSWISFLDPHHPYNPPEPFADLHDDDYVREPVDINCGLENRPSHYKEWRDFIYRDLVDEEEIKQNWSDIIKKYRGKVSHVDDRIGKLLDYLEKVGILDNTILVLSSDHCSPLCDYGIAYCGTYSFEANIKVPLIWSFPDKFKVNGMSDEMVSLIDILPTFFDIIGLEIPLGVQGRSYKKLLLGEEYEPNKSILVEQRWGQKPDGFRTIITKDWKLSIYVNRKEGELYDLVNDPREENNLYGNPQYEEIQNELFKEMVYKMLETQDPLPVRTGEW